MASNKRRGKKNKKNNFIKRHWFGLLTALGFGGGLSIVGYEIYDNIIKGPDELLEKDYNANILADLQDNSKIEGLINIEDDIEETFDGSITFTDEKEGIVEETTEDIVEESEEKEEKEESLDNSKDEKNTITSYSPSDYNYYDLVIPIIKNFESGSIVDVLNDVGYDSSKESRRRLAMYFNIVNNPDEYQGYDYQNTQLLECLRQYARNLQITDEQQNDSAYNDYVNVIDNNTMENNGSDNSNYSYTNDYIFDYIYGSNADNKNDNKDKDQDKDKEPEYNWGEWKELNDEKEYRIREDGEIEEQDHPSYGEWIDNGDGTESRKCSNCGHVHTREKHIHHPEEQTPVVLISQGIIDEEKCKVVKYVCPDEGFIDESKTYYIDHEFPTTPNEIYEDLEEDIYYFICKSCGVEIEKTVPKDKNSGSNGNDEIDSEKKDTGLVINFEFDPSPEDGMEYEPLDEQEPDVTSTLPAIVDNTELEIKEEPDEELEDDTIFLLEDKSSTLQIEGQQDNTQNILASFDTELYKTLCNEKAVAEQSLAANEGIERDEQLQLINNIDAMQMSMVQDLVDALVKEELKTMEQEQAQTLGLRR